ncbi:MAG: hypothetical protein A4S09_17440 [Proteobacteria bacterium SG_bin7]|nr:MAG: hypothetical protein A4S09_17440 [Proteobacteria bacterium SG_bin7]
MEFTQDTFRPKRREICVDNFREPTFAEVYRTIDMAQKLLLSHRKKDVLWDYPASIGTHFMSHYMLIMNWLGISTAFDKERLRKMLLKTQLEDGSWQQSKDINLSTGDINVTVFNYWGLKVMGEPINSSPMRRAREFVVSEGGLEKCAVFAKLILALYKNISWSHVPYTPYIIFSERMIMNYRSFSQWVIPHMFAIAYMRHNRLSKSFGPEYDLSELRRGQLDPLLEPKTPHELIDGIIIKKMLENQQPKGTWGGYTVATLFSVIAMTDFTAHHDKYKKEIQRSIQKSLKRVHDLYFESGEGAYTGHAMDSHYWDTILAGLALVESGYDRKKLRPTADYILSARNPKTGGIPFGFDFEYAPDVDDTAEALLFCASIGMPKRELNKAASWLMSRQSKDGGFGAFDKNNTGNFFLRWITKNLSDSAALFDYSSPDSTGNVMEALASIGYNKENSRTIRRGIRFLKKHQTPQGSWFGRWAINHIFGTACALIGLVTGGEAKDEGYILKAIHWLKSIQNPDGGWGESTKSYHEKNWQGRGFSTPSQTAWALMALIECGLADTPEVRFGVRYLLEEFKKNGKWQDQYVVGTGHPGLIYVEYPSYPYTFPLIALGKYLKAISGK